MTRYQNKINPKLFAEKRYDFVDRILIIDESKGRLVVDDKKFSDFDLTNWKLVK